MSKQFHPATFPIGLAEEFIRFFTKPGEWVIDPFLGAGSTSIAAKVNNRNCVGIELYPDFLRAAGEWTSTAKGEGRAVLIRGDARVVTPKLRGMGLPLMDFCLTSPPYWSQLSAPSASKEKAEERIAAGLDPDYGRDENDLGNILDYEVFLREQDSVFDALFDSMRERAYLVVVTNNVYHNGRLYPLAFDTFRSLSRKWVPKDERIWCQDDKKLRPFGMFHSYIGNRSHHYCLVFRKQTRT